MRAAVLAAPGRIEVTEVAVPEPGAGQVRVRLEGCGVCASNIPPFEGREWFSYPMDPGALGHEGWGVVDAVGAGVTGVEAGDRVASLGQNAYAEYHTAPAEDVIPLPPTLRGVPLPGEPLGCAFNIFARSGVQAGHTVAVVGVGFLGALLVRLAKNAGARVIAVARRPYALDVARQFGADATVEMGENWRVIEQVKRLTGEDLCPVVIEATGKQGPLDIAAELTGVRGRLVVAGYHQDGLRTANLQLWNWRGFDVINAHERDPQVYRDGAAAAVRAVAAGEIDPAPLYTHVLPLERLGEALEKTRDRPDGFLKALVVMG